MKIRLASLLAVLALVVMAVPASAAVNQVSVFVGAATVCADGGSSANCPGGSSGLTLPTGPAREGTYHFENTLACNLLPSANSCTIEVDGFLAPVAGIGAACGLSHGYGGTGTLTDDVTSDVLNVAHVGWVASAGGTLPVTGTYTDPAGAHGPIAGVVQAQGGAGCIGTGGADTFNVVGVVAAL